METADRKPKWHHWTILGLCSLTMLTTGILDVLWGAALNSRFYEIDDVVVRLIGVGFILFSLGLPLRRNWAFFGSISMLVVSILETVVTHDFGVSSPFFTVFILGMILIHLLLPIALLVWLRIVFQPRQGLNQHQDESKQLTQ